MNTNSKLLTIPLSFYSKSLYQTVARHWKGLGFTYLLLLLAITWIFPMILIHRDIQYVGNQLAEPVINQLPVITVKNGTVSVGRPTPILIQSPYPDQKTIIIIDTSGHYTMLDNTTTANVLLTKNSLFVRRVSGDVREYKLQSSDNMVLTPEKANKYMASFKSWGSLIVYAVMLGISFIYRCLQALIYGAIGALIFAKILNVKLTFDAHVRMAAVAVTPVIVLATISEVFNVYFPWQDVLYFLIAMAYLAFAEYSNTKPLLSQSI